MSTVAWCREIDWGNAPQWAGIATAWVFGYVTYRGVRVSASSLQHSRETFAEDVRLREYAQARLVYAEVVETQKTKQGITILLPVRDPKARIIQFPASSNLMPISPGISNGQTMPVTGNSDGAVTVIRIHNTSNELISQVDAKVGDDWFEVGGQAVDVLLAPNAFVEWVVATDAAKHFAPSEVTITFTDATGRVWTRRGGRPVEPVAPSD